MKCISNVYIKYKSVAIFSYQMAAHRLQSLLRDQPERPLERAVFWSEYVIRHDTSHLTLGSQHLNFFQRNLIDVYLIIFAVVIALLSLCIALCVFTLKRLCRLCLKYLSPFVMANIFLVTFAVAYHFFYSKLF